MKRESKSLEKLIPLSFLLGCSNDAVGTYELARLAAVSDLRKQLYTILDMMIEQTALAMLANWFRESDRDAIKQALESEDDPLDVAKRLIRERGRTAEDLIPLPALPRGAAHLAAALRYQERNLAKGLCAVCPQPQARHSVRYCEKHLRDARLKYKPKGAKGAEPGSIDALYNYEDFESRHGRHPNSLAALAVSREKQSRALLAEMGVKPDSAAVSVKAAMEALLKYTPEMKGLAKTFEELMALGSIPMRTTAQKALRELSASGAIERTGVGKKGDPYRYFRSPNS